MEIILCRHGETSWSLSGQHTSFTDLPLTQNGIIQAKAMRSLLLKFNFTHVFSSPMTRAKSTCELALKDPKITIEPLASEWNYGKYEGLTTSEIWQTNPNWNLFSQGSPEGETLDQIANRADLLIQKISQLDENVILFSHGHFLRVLATRWIGLEVSYARLFSLNVASVSVLGFERDQQVIKCWNLTNL